MPHRMWKHTCSDNRRVSWSYPWTCETCQRTAEYDGWHLGVIEHMCRYSARYRLQPIGLHRRMADELFASAEERCEACGGRGLKDSADGRSWHECDACGGFGRVFTRPAEEIEALRRRVLANHPAACSPSNDAPRAGAPIRLELDEPAARDLVYGLLVDKLVFLKRQRAETLAAIQRALWSSSTWGEVAARMPAEAYEELLEVSGATELPDFDEFYAEARVSRRRLTRAAARVEYLALPLDARPPEPRDPFESGDIGAICEGDFPGWPAQEMLEWVPESIQGLYGRGNFSFVSGDFLEFDSADEHEIVAAFVALGYTCVRDDALVERASGWSE